MKKRRIVLPMHVFISDKVRMNCAIAERVIGAIGDGVDVVDRTLSRDIADFASALVNRIYENNGVELVVEEPRAPGMPMWESH